MTRPPDPTRVTNLNDDGVGSLRWAIANVPERSTIRFASNLEGKILLTSGNLTINKKKLTISSLSKNTLFVSSNAGFGLFVNPGASVTIYNLNFKNSNGTTSISVVKGGQLTLSGSVISGNISTNAGSILSNGGGSIFNSGTLIMTNCMVSNNRGGASIYNGDGGTMILKNCTVTNNTLNEPNIINNTGGKLTIVDCTISNNVSAVNLIGLDDTGGGGIYNDGILTVTSSTISANKAVPRPEMEAYSVEGGGILNGTHGELTLISSTVYDNMAFGNGGGVAIIGGKAKIMLCTIYKNHSNSNGGGISIQDGRGYGAGVITFPVPSKVTMSGSIVAANDASHDLDISGTLISGGYNLIENIARSTGLNPVTNRQVTLADLKLDPILRNNGGSTQTLALLQGSPAIDYVPSEACSITVTDASGHTEMITTDQRGEHRPDGSENACDVGAYESSY